MHKWLIKMTLLKNFKSHILMTIIVFVFLYLYSFCQNYTLRAVSLKLLLDSSSALVHYITCDKVMLRDMLSDGVENNISYFNLGCSAG